MNLTRVTFPRSRSRWRGTVPPRATCYSVDEGDPRPNRVPIGFRPNTSMTRWGEAIWTARDLAEGAWLPNE